MASKMQTVLGLSPNSKQHLTWLLPGSKLWHGRRSDGQRTDIRSAITGSRNERRPSVDVRHLHVAGLSGAAFRNDAGNGVRVVVASARTPRVRRRRGAVVLMRLEGGGTAEVGRHVGLGGDGRTGRRALVGGRNRVRPVAARRMAGRISGAHDQRNALLLRFYVKGRALGHGGRSAMFTGHLQEATCSQSLQFLTDITPNPNIKYK